MTFMKMTKKSNNPQWWSVELNAPKQAIYCVSKPIQKDFLTFT